MSEVKAISCPIGQDGNGNTYFCDWKKVNHLLIGGTNGTERISFLHGLICSLVKGYAPNEVGIALIDGANRAFGVYEGVLHLVGGLKEMERELEERSLRLPCKSKREIIVLVADYIALTSDEKAIVETLVRFGHGVGMHVLLATSEFANETLSPIIKAMATTVVAFKVDTEVESRCLLGGVLGAENLQDGAFLYGEGEGKTTLLRAINMQAEEIDALVAMVKKAWAGQYVCPVCGQTVFAKKNGYDICEWCGWEDDLDYERWPDDESGANGCTVDCYRAKYAEKCRQNPNYKWSGSFCVHLPEEEKDN
jgi:DNA segregation ATPase FtsK/SpoIIIE-like protein